MTAIGQQDLDPAVAGALERGDKLSRRVLHEVKPLGSVREVAGNVVRTCQPVRSYAHVPAARTKHTPDLLSLIEEVVRVEVFDYVVGVDDVHAVVRQAQAEAVKNPELEVVSTGEGNPIVNVHGNRLRYERRDRLGDRAIVSTNLEECVAGSYESPKEPRLRRHRSGARCRVGRLSDERMVSQTRRALTVNDAVQPPTLFLRRRGHKPLTQLALNLEMLSALIGGLHDSEE